jgi:hypothetical protein
MKRILAAIVITIAAAAGTLTAISPAHAASQGAGFGTWAPISAYGWHGSMLIDGVHTYCIRPGLPAPTGQSSDQGVSGSAAGLSAAQLTGINLLVSKYGQTDDPVQAASVGWAVKAIADWDETLHAFGYRGDSLAGAINWTFSSLAPASNEAVQSLATAYYAEATSTPAGSLGGTGSLVFTTDPTDPVRGTVAVTASSSEATGAITLEHAVFVDSGSATRDGVRAGSTYEITALSPDAGGPFRVRGSGTLRGGYQAAVRHFTTAGGQDTAGPGGNVEFPVAGEDAADRYTTFAPVITTQVVSRYVSGGRFVDDVTFATARGVWPRVTDGGYAPVSATATVYRTPNEPSQVDAAPDDTVPDEAEPVGELVLTTAPDTGPTVPYRVESDGPLPGPGFYTAVWTIRADAQTDEVRDAMDDAYTWAESFGEQSQITMVSAISSQAEPVVAVGATMSDEVIVDGSIPASGLDLTVAVYRATDEDEPEETCTPDNLVWSNADAPVHISEPGRTRVTAPVVPDFGTYYWQERALDTEDRLVHEGACGLESETTHAPLPTVITRAGSSSGFGGTLTDTATVSGPVPVHGATTLTFELYLADAGADLSSACTAENLVGDTGREPVAVTAEGEYTSPAIRTHTSGTHVWVEQLWFTPEGEREARLLSRGACGVVDETTVVESPGVTTVATERAATGAPFADTATVTGLAPDAEAELVFFVYRNDLGEAPTCSADRLIAETSPVTVRGSGSYASPDVRSDLTGVMQWVAELRHRSTPDAEAVVLYRGACGEESESTFVGTLAATGSEPESELPVGLLGAAGAGAVALGLTLAMMLRIRARRASTALK